MPDPNGCYVLVYEQSEFLGPREFVNGPAEYVRLTELPYRQNWRRRIRSARVGPDASVSVWVNEAFGGPMMVLGRNAPYSTLPEAFSGRIESLEITCGVRPRDP